MRDVTAIPVELAGQHGASGNSVKNLTESLQIDYKDSKDIGGYVMDLLVIELVLWGGLFFLFWALKDGLGRVESDLESMGLLNGSQLITDFGEQTRYINPERLTEPIGSYRDKPIYRYAVIDGSDFQFDHVRPLGSCGGLREHERCIAPGLVYVLCDAGRRA
jgi:hypothetical protein